MNRLVASGPRNIMSWAHQSNTLRWATIALLDRETIMQISQLTRLNSALSTIIRNSGVLALAAAMLVLPSAARGAEDPAWFVIQTETEPVRCGDQEIYYTIHEFQRGTVVGIDGTSGDYSKVRYPADLGALVPARDAQSIKAGSHIRLLEDSTLSAASMLRGIDGSWCPVYIEPLKAGTEMAVLEVVRDEDNEIKGYMVAPPRPPVVAAYPHGYVRTESLRPATADEIKQHQGGKQITTGRPKLTAGPKATPKKADPEPEVAEPEVVKAADPVEEEIIDLREPMVTPKRNDASFTPPVQVADDPAPETGPAVIKNTIPVVISPEKSTKVTITAASLEALEASFVNARSMPRAQLDEALSELLAEFTRTRQATSDDDSAVRPLDQRIEWLNIRIETRDQRRAIAGALATADDQSLELSSKIKEWNNSRVYTLVGRLMTSGVYTGEHLPLLYRVRAPDPISGFERTVGYIAPGAGQDFRQYLGKVVGVVGDPVRDDALAFTVLSPTRVELMPDQ